MKEDKAKTEAAATEAPAQETPEVREVRHTISSEETFTLAKDIYDIRCAVRKVWSNRAQISRRLNILSLAFSLAFTAVYVAIILYLGLTNSLSVGWEIAVWTILGVYGALFLVFAACALVFSRGSAKNYKKHGKILKVFRYLVRLASLVMSCFAVGVAFSEGASDSLSLAVRTVTLIISIFSIILSAIPLIFGGLGGVARWLLSPTKVNKRFSSVALEWYGYAMATPAQFASTSKVDKGMLDDISRCIDGYILPAFGRRKLASINSNHIFAAVDLAPAEDRPTVEGILKNVFDYAVECNYTTYNPCADLKLEGSIEVYEKPKKEPLKVRIGKKIGSSIIKQFLGEKPDKK